MEKKAGAGAHADAPAGRSEANPEGKQSSAYDTTGSFAVFESLETLRQAPVEPEPASADQRQDGEEGNLQAVLNRYSDWLKKLDK